VLDTLIFFYINQLELKKKKLFMLLRMQIIIIIITIIKNAILFNRFIITSKGNVVWGYYRLAIVCFFNIFILKRVINKYF